jgi:hypothetical protein
MNAAVDVGRFTGDQPRCNVAKAALETKAARIK